MQRRDFGGFLGVLALWPALGNGQSIRETSVKLVQHGDVSLATQTFGRQGDPALLMIMGATASMLGWPNDLCEALAQHGLFVIRFDHRDTGESTTIPPGRVGYAVEDLAADAMAILDDYGITEAHLLGMSLGGYIGQMIALDHPERIISLTLIASEPLGWDGEPLPNITPAFLEHFADLQGLDWSDRDAVTDFLMTSERLSAGSGYPFDEEAVRARVSQVLDRTQSPASMFNHAMITVRQDWTGRFREISVPVLVFHGEEDPILPVANGRALSEGRGGAHYIELAGVGHELPDALTEDIAQSIAEFLRGL